MKLNNKNKLIILISVFFIIIAYKIAISKTFYYYNTYNVAKQQIINSENEIKIIKFLQAKNKKLDAILINNNFSENSTNHQNFILKVVSNLCEKNATKILNFEEPEMITIDSKIKILYKFSVEGNFNTVLLILNQLEKKPNIGKIIHFSTEKKMNFKENKNIIISYFVIEKK